MTHKISSDTVELKPCPFCGGKAELSETHAGGDTFVFQASCNNDECKMNNCFYSSHYKEDCIATWNTRAPQKPALSEDEIVEIMARAHSPITFERGNDGAKENEIVCHRRAYRALVAAGVIGGGE